MLKSLYSYRPKPANKEPEWFNGFIRLDQYSKNPKWSKYIYLPSYYSEGAADINHAELGMTINPEINNICPAVTEHYKNLEHREFSKNTKTERCAKIVNKVGIINLATGTKEYHPCIYANQDYVIRPVAENDTDDIKRIIDLANKEIEIKIPFRVVKPWIKKGLIIVVVSKHGEIHGLQTFSFMDRQISHEPLTYIGDEARGQGIFNIYHDLVVELGKEVKAKYVYNQCRPDMKIAEIYKHYGYVLQDKTVVESGHKYAVYHFPIDLDDEKQQSFF